MKGEVVPRIYIRSCEFVKFDELFKENFFILSFAARRNSVARGNCMKNAKSP